MSHHRHHQYHFHRNWPLILLNLKSNCRQLKPDSHRNKKHKTSIKWRTLHPVFNEEFSFETRPSELDKQSLVITVWDKDIGKPDDFLGSLLIGHNSKGRRWKQWKDCIRLPDHFHEQWHCLSSELNPH